MPTLRSLPEGNKLQARIEILRTLQKLTIQPSTSMFNQTPRYSASSSSMYQSYNEPYHPIPTHVYSNPLPATTHQITFPPFQPSVQQSFHSNTTSSSHFPQVNQIVNASTSSSSTSMLNEPAVSPASVASNPSMHSFISESTVSDILDLE